MNSRPKLKVNFTKFDIFLEYISIVALILNVILVNYAWSNLPARIPSHFDLSGQIDGYGGKSILIFLFAITFILYIGLTILGKFPHIYNYTVEITEKNAQVQYKLAVRLLALVKTFIVLLFTFIQVMIVKSALTNKSSIGFWFFPVIMVIIFGVIGIYIYKSHKAS